MVKGYIIEGLQSILVLAVAHFTVTYTAVGLECHVKDMGYNTSLIYRDGVDYVILLFAYVWSDTSSTISRSLV